jgi:hypothetical protein
LLTETPEPEPEPEPTGDVVAGFWRALNDHVQGTLTTFTVADLAGARTLP